PCPVIISLFFVLRPLLPPSTLFPYTTLFRSPLLSTISSDRATYLPTLSPFPNGDMLNSRSTIAHVPFFEGTGYFSSLRPKKSCLSPFSVSQIHHFAPENQAHPNPRPFTPTEIFLPVLPFADFPSLI